MRMSVSAVGVRLGWALGAMVLLCGVLVSGRAWAAEAKPFGIASLTLQMTADTRVINEGAGPNCEPCQIVNDPYVPQFTQAGGHPWALTTTGRFTSEEVTSVGGHVNTIPTRDPKDIVVDLPPGLLGNPQALPRCPLAQLVNFIKCPADTQVGFARLATYGDQPIAGPIVNLTPEAGQSAEFGIETISGVNFVLTAHVVRTAQGYGLAVVSNGVPLVELSEFEVTFWGVPADPSHDPLRGMFCATASSFDCQGGGQHAGIAAVPFLSMPTDCGVGPGVGTVRADSWEEPGRVRDNGVYEGYSEAQVAFPGATGCNLLGFGPSLEIQPDTFLADEPVGLGVNLQVPQVESPAAPVTPQVRDAVITLPEGMSVSPGVADGIQACDETGPHGINFTGPESEEPGVNGELQLAAGHCPDASIVGTAEAITPLLGEPVKGHVYLARPGCGGPGQGACTETDALDGNLYKLYLELGGTGPLANTGVNIKVAGEVDANPATGQLTTKFLGTPQLPFSELKVHLNGGPRAPLDNPAVCGPALTTADFTPWSTPGVTPEGLGMAGTADATPSSFFEVGGCGSPPGLSPVFQAGTVTPQAGQFSAFTLSLSRQDREQYVKGLQVHTPPGLLGVLASVPLCGEPAASDGTCSEVSRIGTARVASGAGSHPFEIEGTVYLTGGYGGSPFGLSIVTHAVAGPFNLGTVVVRARIAVDPETSALTITTDETGPFAIPQILDGVPLRLQRVTVAIDRPGFMFNPTNCNAQQITASVVGSQNTTATVASPFAVGGCKSLAFKPSFKVATSGHTSKKGGASLDAKLSFPAGSLGSEANVASVKVWLPKQLPSRLTTLQKACTAAAFDANPASCPASSIVGIAKATSPLLAVGLAGPVYFVSHGGEAFPSLIVVLQGEGVRVNLTGTTAINKQGVTSSTFKTVPDVPVSTFELYLPEGQYSALGVNGVNLCQAASKLRMPTEFTAQNGAVFKQSTKIQVTGCKASKAKPRKRRAAKASSGNHAPRTTRASLNSTGDGRAGR